ncbi:TVP38/TMEM64 family protein [Candidatus Uhrbacteria bacterium]|nr:TVP38/TMEM64 family protein [Candidatus Uhrbacteria bacterium]
MRKFISGNIGKIVVGLIWVVALISAYRWFLDSDIPMRQVPRALKGIVASYGIWGPAVILGLHAARSFFFLPSMPLVLVAGSLYGPWWGMALTIAGDNISANISFVLGRFFGRRYVKQTERGWLKKYDELLTRDGFMAVLLMRLLYFPFDVVNLGSGLSGIPYRQYLVATFIGLIPAIVTFTFLGDAFVNPRAFIVFAILFVLTLVCAWLIKRSRWAQKMLLHPKHHDSIFEEL